MYRDDTITKIENRNRELNDEVGKLKSQLLIKNGEMAKMTKKYSPYGWKDRLSWFGIGPNTQAFLIIVFGVAGVLAAVYISAYWNSSVACSYADTLGKGGHPDHDMPWLGIFLVMYLWQGLVIMLIRMLHLDYVEKRAKRIDSDKKKEMEDVRKSK